MEAVSIQAIHSNAAPVKEKGEVDILSPYSILKDIQSSPFSLLQLTVLPTALLSKAQGQNKLQKISTIFTESTHPFIIFRPIFPPVTIIKLMLSQ